MIGHQPNNPKTTLPSSLDLPRPPPMQTNLIHLNTLTRSYLGSIFGENIDNNYEHAAKRCKVCFNHPANLALRLKEMPIESSFADLQSANSLQRPVSMVPLSPLYSQSANTQPNLTYLARTAVLASSECSTPDPFASGPYRPPQLVPSPQWNGSPVYTGSFMPTQAFSMLPIEIPCHYNGCNKTFPSKTRLDRHIVTHSGEKKYACLAADCDKKFSRRDNMLQHYRAHLVKVRYQRQKSDKK
jgi:uncharacterized Zn-finger protein